MLVKHEVSYRIDSFDKRLHYVQDDKWDKQFNDHFTLR